MPPRRAKKSRAPATAATTATSLSTTILTNRSSPSASQRDANAEPEPLSPEDILSDSHIFEHARPFYKSRVFHFVFGVLAGAFIALSLYMAPPSARLQLEEFQHYIALSFAELDLPTLLPQSLLVEEFMANLTNLLNPPAGSDGQPFQPALQLKEEFGLEPHFSVMLIPGIVSSGLESWSTSNCSAKYFRKRMWGTMTMFRAVLTDKECWVKHLKLDPVTGLDPPGIKLRASQGLDAADYFVPGYWIWGKIIENLAAVGYDSNNMHLAAYDWRLSFDNLEHRDHYFSRLKQDIEHSRQWKGLKSVIIAHSMGSLVFYYFLKWVESPLGGNAGPNWTEDHIESFINIAGPMMGVPKGLTALLSGETRDTMDLGSYGAYILEKFFSKNERADLFRSWAGGSSMLPKGGEHIWGNLSWAPDDRHPHCRDVSYGNLLSFPSEVNCDVVDDPALGGEGTRDQATIIRNYTALTGIELLHQSTLPEYHELLKNNYSFGITMSKKEIEKNEMDPRKWTNTVESRLPLAPSMRVYCFYGVGVETERSYFYTRGELENNEVKLVCRASEDEGEICERLNETNAMNLTHDEGKSPKRLGEFTFPPKVYIDGRVHDPDSKINTGVHFGEGDGTVPLLSNGYMCASGWTTHADLYNPARSPIITREYLHEASASALDIRGGSKASDHVNILGNHEMMADILKIVCNRPDNVDERYHSDIKEYGDRVKIEHLP